jgi:uncharacterized protein YbjT (DUF2867 family)
VATSFVAGATGFVGRHVVAQLAARGGVTVAHVRPDSSELARWRARFAEQGARLDTTPWELEAMAERLRQLRPEVIYVCIGTTQKRAAKDGVAGSPYERVDYGLTKLIVEAARRASETAGAADAPATASAAASTYRPRLVYLSSIGAKPDARSAYLSWRGKAEEAVKASGLPWMIAQPSFITEAGGAPDGSRDDARPGEKVGAAIGDAVLGALGLFGARQLRARYRSTTPDVLAAALIRMGEAAEPDKVLAGDELR